MISLKFNLKYKVKCSASQIKIYCQNGINFWKRLSLKNKSYNHQLQYYQEIMRSKFQLEEVNKHQTDILKHQKIITDKVGKFDSCQSKINLSILMEKSHSKKKSMKMIKFTTENKSNKEKNRDKDKDKYLKKNKDNKDNKFRDKN